jgi:hypothetical protein
MFESVIGSVAATSHFVAETWHSTPSPVKTILTAAFGTAIGAWLTSRAQAKRRVIEELRAVRSAHALSFTVTNKALALKLQHIRSTQRAYAAHLKKGHGQFQLKLDLQNLTQVRFAGEAIAKIVMEKCSAEPKALAATVSLLDSTEDLRLSIDYRNKLIAEFRDDLPGSHKEIIEFYLGVPSETAVDERLKSNIIALSRQVDDCIFFSKFLADCEVWQLTPSKIPPEVSVRSQDDGAGRLDESAAGKFGPLRRRIPRLDVRLPRTAIEVATFLRTALDQS